MRRRLRVEPAESRRFGDALHRDGLGGQAWIDPVGARPSPDGVGGRQDLPAQALVDLLEGPRECRSVLGPFEVADDDAPGVAQDVRDDDDPVSAEDRVGVRRTGPFGGFGEDPRPDGVGIRRRDLPLERRQDEDVDIEPEEFVVLDRSRSGRAGDRAVLAEMAPQERDVESVGIGDAAVDVGDRDDASPAS